ncbi:hypothetical protein LUZ60_006711 [Juncus effusus]|nr:hypothetical protein LUZ60_006711 [Juncus effusus]
MLSGIKFIPKDELLKDDGSSDSDESKYNKRKEKKRSKKRYDSTEESSSDSDEELGRKKRSKKDKKKRKKHSSRGEYSDEDSEEEKELNEEKNKNDVLRKEMGLDWMLQSNKKLERNLQTETEEKLKGQFEDQTEEVKRSNPKELNPYFKDDGTGYPDEEKINKGENNLLNISKSVVGDGGASWRLKALRRAKEQAAREGRKLDEVVGERWSSLGDLAASISTSKAASSHAHLHAIRGRKSNNQSENPSEKPKEKLRENRDYLKDVSTRNPEMRRPRNDGNLNWRKKSENKGQNSNLSLENRELLNEAVAGINKFDNDGSFLDKIRNLDGKKERDQSEKLEVKSSGTGTSSVSLAGTEGLTKNQLAAKILQLKMKGKHQEADLLSKQMEAMDENPHSDSREESRGYSSRQNTIIKPSPSERRRKEDDSDLHLAKQISQNKKYSTSQTVEDEYEHDFDGNAPARKKNKRKGPSQDRGEMGNRQMLGAPQKERCLFCFENPARPKHLVVSIGNFTYLMLPQRQPVVPGHCLILPLQHEAATRNIDNNVWEEIRNFKKCLIQMFAKEEKDVVFLETVIGLSKQKRHCLVECIPIPHSLSNSAPMYFKKAIDEVEDEWEQHSAKKLIPTSGNLKNVIPSNFSYFHVEFGLDRGFVHIIDDETKFSAGFGLNVVRGMLELPEEDMHRKRRYESDERQKEAVERFVKGWESFDWTRQL